MSGRSKKFDVKKAIVWVLTVMISMTMIFVGNKAVMKDAAIFVNSGSDTVFKAEVTEVMESGSDTLDLGSSNSYENSWIGFKCELKNGDDKGKVVEAMQTIDSLYAGSQYIKPVEVGDKVMVVYSEDQTMSGTPWQFSDYYRFGSMAILACIFMALILVIGRWKGVNTLLSLVFTFLFVFLVFVPAVMAGYNAYLWSIITCVFTIVMTLLLINSTSRKTLATVIGCISGTLIAGVVTVIMSNLMGLTGFTDEHSYYLTMLDTQNPIDLKAVIFAAIIIGAVGAIMDVAMDIASSLNELSQHVPDITFGQLCKSGMNIGRDIMGTMANTLVLAYIGSSLSCIMILLTYAASVIDLLNREIIIVELLTAIAGSLALLLTVPCTVITCGLLYIGRRKKR